MRWQKNNSVWTREHSVKWRIHWKMVQLELDTSSKSVKQSVSAPIKRLGNSIPFTACIALQHANTNLIYMVVDSLTGISRPLTHFFPRDLCNKEGCNRRNLWAQNFTFIYQVNLENLFAKEKQISLNVSFYKFRLIH